MSENKDQVFELQEKGFQVLGKIFGAAHPEAVYGKPITKENITLITTSEVFSAGGYGQGFGEFKDEEEQETKESDQTAENKEGHLEGGIGGGGTSYGRPVAVIKIKNGEVSVQPIVDITKIGLAFLTTLGSIFLMGAKIRKKVK